MAKEILAEQGIDLEVVEFSDYVQPNLVTESGEVDANYFQHTPYLDSFNEENGTHLVSVGAVHYEPFGIYPGKSDDLANIADGATIAVPNDTTNEARALQLLAAQGLITVRDGAGLTATVNDITDNPHNLQIKEIEAAQLPRTVQDVDFAVINGNYAMEAGFSVARTLLLPRMLPPSCPDLRQRTGCEGRPRERPRHSGAVRCPDQRQGQGLHQQHLRRCGCADFLRQHRRKRARADMESARWQNAKKKLATCQNKA